MRFGLDQLGVPAPVLYKRLCNGYIIILAPSLVAFIAMLPLDPTLKHICTGGLVVLGSLVKLFEYVIGEDPTPTRGVNAEPPK